MTQAVDSLLAVASDYDAIVFDQWGVLHDGTAPYQNARRCLVDLHAAGHRLSVLSNSGKRAAPNAARIQEMGFPSKLFEYVMTSGEALWQDIAQDRIEARSFFPIERVAGDAMAWADGLDIALEPDIEKAGAVLLMGLPDGSALEDWAEISAGIVPRGLTIYCSNPDRASPRAGGRTVVSPGALAFSLRDAGCDVVFYGKPHRPIFSALQKQLGAERLLMIGDSLEHDIAGGQNAGWDTVLVKGGLYRAEFAAAPDEPVLRRLADEKDAPLPTYLIEDVR